MSMPIGAYSGSYQPAPMPTSSRPPQMTSRVASDLASTEAGRSASQSTSVPRRARVTIARERGERDDRVEAHRAGRAGRRTSRRRGRGGRDSHNESNPARSAAHRELDDRVPAQRRLARDRVVVLREREPERASRGTLPVVVPRAGRTLHGCSSACPTCPKGATARVLDALARGVRSRRCSTCTSTPTTTARCSPWPARRARRRAAVRRLARRGGRARRPHRARGRAPAPRRARRGAVRRARRHRPPATRSTPRARSRAWVADDARAPGVPLRRRRSDAIARCPTLRRDAFTRARARPRPVGTAPDAGRGRGRRAPAARGGELRARPRRPRARRARSRDRCASATAGCPVCARSGSRLDVGRSVAGVDEPGRARAHRAAGRVRHRARARRAPRAPRSRASSWSGWSPRPSSPAATTSSSRGRASAPTRRSRPASRPVADALRA